MNELIEIARLLSPLSLVAVGFLLKTLIEKLVKADSLNREHQISRLHEKRAGIIAELYNKLTLFIENTPEYGQALFDDSEHNSERFREIQHLMSDFLTYYKNHKIYFPKSFCNQLEELQNIVLQLSLETPSVELTTKVMTLQENLQDEFRKILGVENS